MICVVFSESRKLVMDIGMTEGLRAWEMSGKGGVWTAGF